MCIFWIVECVSAPVDLMFGPGLGALSGVLMLSSRLRAPASGLSARVRCATCGAVGGGEISLRG